MRADIKDYTSDVSIDLLVAEMDADAKADEQTQIVKALAEEADINVLTQNLLRMWIFIRSHCPL